MKVCSSGILLRKNRILLGKRSSDREFYPNAWDTIGGHSKERETPEQTLFRELNEEIGVVPIKYHLISILTDPKPEIHGDYQFYVYLITSWEGSPRNLSSREHSALEWFTIEQASNLNLAHPQYPELFNVITKFANKMG